MNQKKLLLIALSLILFDKTMIKNSMIPIFFITGTSGSGKTTVMHHLQQSLPPLSFAVYDFDENGVPENADQQWRIDTTAFWINKAVKNNQNNQTTIICGVSVPSEICTIIRINKLQLMPYFGFMKIDESTIRKRLHEREWSTQLVKDNIHWALHLEQEVMQQQNHLIIDCSIALPQEIADIFAEWVQKGS